MKKFDKSTAQLFRAELSIPLGSQTFSKSKTQYPVGISPLYASKSKGAYLWDIDDNKYIDLVNSLAAVTLGYGDKGLQKSILKQLKLGVSLSLPTKIESEVAELVIDLVPSAEMVRFSKNGSDATSAAIRLARAFTGRDQIVACGYHGWHDWYIAANLAEEASLNSHLFPGIEPTGVPRGLAGTALPFSYGNLDELSDLLEKNKGQVAAIIMEPLRSSMPPDGYLAGVKTLCADHGAIFIMDEITAGIRYSTGGAQQYLGVIPDMAVFAKSISNGYPMGVVVGKREFMEPASRMFISSTYWSDTIGLRATLSTLNEVRRRDVPGQLQKFGAELKRGLKVVANEVGLDVGCIGNDVMPMLQFSIDDQNLKNQAVTLYIQEMAKRGCHGYASFYLNAAQGEAELGQTLQAARETFIIIRDGIARKKVADLLECSVQKDAFRRLVK